LRLDGLAIGATDDAEAPNEKVAIDVVGRSTVDEPRDEERSHEGDQEGQGKSRRRARFEVLIDLHGPPRNDQEAGHLDKPQREQTNPDPIQALQEGDVPETPAEQRGQTDHGHESAEPKRDGSRVVQKPGWACEDRDRIKADNQGLCGCDNKRNDKQKLRQSSLGGPGTRR
jgi:hypothetical protein